MEKNFKTSLVHVGKSAYLLKFVHCVEAVRLIYKYVMTCLIVTLHKILAKLIGHLLNFKANV